jgi:glycosyltransferase involved in cell wall biosynthesis
VLEAMEYGKPILVTDTWTLPATTCAKFGWRVPAEDRAFEAALLEAMSTPEDGLADLGQVARTIARQHFGWDYVAKQTCSVYASLLAGVH